MKIQNPTVFLKDGALFCLTVEVPQVPDHYETEKQMYDVDSAIKAAKSSAVRIKNQKEFWFSLNRKARAERNDSRVYHSFFADGTVQTLNGYEAEVKDETIIDCDQTCDENCDMCWHKESIATITLKESYSKEESQEELWKEVRHLIEEWQIEKLHNSFTITRK